MIDRPILITGCARSGTSWIARIVNKAGAFGGALAGPNSSNRKGMFENKSIRNGLIKPLLRRMEVDPLGQKPLPDIQVCHSLAVKEGIKIREGVLKILESQGYSVGQWFFKGAKMCLIWPILHVAFPNAKWIIVRRCDEGIVKSCLRTPFMRHYRDKQGWQYWVDEHKKRFVEMKAAGLDICEVDTDQLASGDTTELNACLLRYDLHITLTEDLIESSLFHVKQGVINA